MKYADDTARRRPGRPLSFDREAALHKAMLLFWRQGYESTSVTELTAAMGISAPSLYAAFGDKKHLFLEAIGRYTSGPVTAAGIIGDAVTARAAARDLLRGAAVGLTGRGTPRGCMLVSSATNCSATAADVQSALAEIRRTNQRALRKKIEMDIDAGLLANDTDAAALASLTMAVIQGMSTQARDGANRGALLSLADAAMQAWPLEPAGNRG